MKTKFVLAAQLQTNPSLIKPGSAKRALNTIYQAAEQGGLDLLAVGGDEAPFLFETLTVRKDRRHRIEQVYLWYTVLADNPTLESSQTAINFHGKPLHGLVSSDTSESLHENFRFACPNHPGVKANILAHLDVLLQRYDFDGVFLDKIRFPSPANGLDEMLSCFCPHCHRAATAFGLDLEQVRVTLVRPHLSADASQRSRSVPSLVAGWTAALLKDLPLIQQFLAFRADCITRLVGEISSVIRQRGRQLALDLFSPGLAPWVGQDYRALTAYAAWCKPMVYRYANGPAGLRMEIPKLIQELEDFTNLTPSAAWAFATHWVPELSEITRSELAAGHIPLSLIAYEAASAVRLFMPKPVYVGIEAVKLPQFDVDMTPATVKQLILTAREAGAAGAVLSWDVLAMPPENIRAAREAAD